MRHHPATGLSKLSVSDITLGGSTRWNVSCRPYISCVSISDSAAPLSIFPFPFPGFRPGSPLPLSRTASSLSLIVEVLKIILRPRPVRWLPANIAKLSRQSYSGNVNSRKKQKRDKGTVPQRPRRGSEIPLIWVANRSLLGLRSPRGAGLKSILASPMLFQSPRPRRSRRRRAIRGLCCNRTRSRRVQDGFCTAREPPVTRRSR